MVERACPICENPNPEDATLCKHCGASLMKPDSPPESQSEMGEPDESSTSQPRPFPWDELEGALPSEPINYYSRPLLVVNSVQTTDSERNLIGLLEEMIIPRGEEKEIPVPPRRWDAKWTRLIFLAFLISGLLAGMFLIQNQKIEVDLPPELVAVTHWVNDLPPGVPVLVAVDYPASAIGEMEIAASPLISHLMSKQAYLVLVSTQPTGPLQAEKLIDQVKKLRQEQSGGFLYDQYVNLGFIPGGASGLAGFVYSPAEFAENVLSSYKSTQPDPWTMPPLSGVTSLDGFAMILVISENPDTARAWIEQVRPKLNWTPLVLVLSVQAEPVIRPYADHQPATIQGMVIGVAGGAGYEELTNIQTGAQKSWPVYAVGTWILGIGMVFALGMNWLVNLIRRGQHGANKGEKE
jgi:hypothetical protein